MEPSSETTEDSKSLAPATVPGDGATREETDSPFPHQEAYRGAWERFLAPFLPLKEDAPPPDSEMLNRQLEKISRRARLSLDAGIQIPVESFFLSHDLDLVDRILFMALARETWRFQAMKGYGDEIRTIRVSGSWAMGGSSTINLHALLNAVASVPREEVDRRLEKDGVLSTLALVQRAEVDSGGFWVSDPKEFVYQIEPRGLHVIQGMAAFPWEEGELGEPGDGLYERFLHQLLLVYAVAVETDDADWEPYIRYRHIERTWFLQSKNLTTGEWGLAETGRVGLRYLIQALARAAKDPFGKLIKEQGFDMSSSMVLAILMLAHAHGHTSAPGNLIQAVAGLSWGTHPNLRDLIGEEAPLVTSRVIQVEGNGPHAGRKVRISAKLFPSLIPYVITPDGSPTEDLLGDPVELIESDGRTLDNLVFAPVLRETLEFHTRRLFAAGDTLATWGFRNKSQLRSALLFHGPPGTGKTAAARAIATEQGRDLYRLRIDQVFAKWVGDSEKLVASAFRRAKDGKALLLLDEADCFLLDRDQDYRNLHTPMKCLLLQEIEAFEEPLILTTNRLDALDKALERRLSATLEFALPGIPERRALWRLYLPQEAPIAADVDFETLARSFEMSGAGIERACVQAAAVAATRPEANRVIRMSDLMDSARKGTPKTPSVRPSEATYQEGHAKQIRQATDWDLEN